MRKDVELSKMKKELTKEQKYIMEYIMMEEELTQETSKAKSGAEGYWQVVAKHLADINSLTQQLNLEKKHLTPKPKKRNDMSRISRMMERRKV